MLEKRVEKLEKEVAALIGKGRTPTRKRNPSRTFGIFQNDPDFEAASRLGGSIESSRPARRRLLVLDTDHFSEWERGSAAGFRLRTRLGVANTDMAVTGVTVEEQMRGWLAEIRRHNDPRRQISPYAKFQRQVEAFADWMVLAWDADGAELFLNLRRQGLRLGTMDLKVACITLVHEATLLTLNARDFAEVPGLRFENWLE